MQLLKGKDCIRLFSRGSRQMVRKQIGMLFTLFMELEILQ